MRATFATLATIVLLSIFWLAAMHESSAIDAAASVHNARGHKERMDALFEEQLKHDAESESHRLRLMQSSDEQALHDEFSSTCSRTLPVCKTPLVQVIDPLDPSFAGRRASVDRIMG